MDCGYAALTLSILEAVPPETSFHWLENGRQRKRTELTDEDTKDMITLHDMHGHTWKEVGEMYGMTFECVYHRQRVFRKGVA
jgi:hypothetical protein